MEMLHPEGNIDTQWVDNVSALLREMISQLSAECTSRRVRVRSAGSARARLLHDVRQPLLTLAQAHEGNNLASEFLSQEKTISDQIQALWATRDHEVAVAEARDAAAALLDGLAQHHDALLQLHSNWASESGARRLTRQQALAATGKANATRQGGERNAVGAGVWKRVRLKLEGRDDANTQRRHALHDQVEHMIKEAVCSGNLCMMYEGWMAWV